MNWTVRLAKEAAKQLSDLLPQQQELIRRRLWEIADDPFRGDVKALRGRWKGRPDMPNGRPGDDLLRDILDYKLPVFSPTIDKLIRDIDKLGGIGEPILSSILDKSPVDYVPVLNEWRPKKQPGVAYDDARLKKADFQEFERQLRELRDRLKHQARSRSWWRRLVSYFGGR